MEDDDVTTDAVHEILRYTSPVQLTRPRFATANMMFHGQEIERGEAILAVIAAANGDPEKFSDPHRFQIDRRPNYHLALGPASAPASGCKWPSPKRKLPCPTRYFGFPRSRFQEAGRSTVPVQFILDGIAENRSRV